MIAFVRCTVILIGLALLVQSQSGTVLFGPLPANSLDLYVEKTGLLSGKKHHFVFTDYNGRLDMAASVEFTIRSASITCRDTWVKNSDILKIEQVAKKGFARDRHVPVNSVSVHLDPGTPKRQVSRHRHASDS